MNPERETEIRTAWSSLRDEALQRIREPQWIGQGPRIGFSPVGPLPTAAEIDAGALAEREAARDTFVFERRRAPDGGVLVLCEGVEVERVAGPTIRPWRNEPDVHEVAGALNHMRIGDGMLLNERVLGLMSFNQLLYGDLWHALRGNLIGSAFGSFRRRVREDGSWIITRHDEGERLYDRDGHPLSRISFSDPTTTRD